MGTGIGVTVQQIELQGRVVETRVAEQLHAPFDHAGRGIDGEVPWLLVEVAGTARFGGSGGWWLTDKGVGRRWVREVDCNDYGKQQRYTDEYQ